VGRQKETRGSPARSGRSVNPDYTPGWVDGSSVARARLIGRHWTGAAVERLGEVLFVRRGWLGAASLAR
jgi:hypothetical protein